MIREKQTRKDNLLHKMQGTGKSYEVSGETTEWEDILIKKGIKTKEEVLIEKGLNPLDVRLNFSSSLPLKI